MDAQGDGVSNPDAETITDIQNYLASFNKEIQDGTPATTTGGGDVQGTVQAEGNEEGTATYYVTQTSDGTQIENYQYGDQNQAHFEGGTFYASSDATTYYTGGATTGHEEGLTAYTTGDSTQPTIANIKTEVPESGDVENSALLEGTSVMTVSDQQQPVRVTIRQAGSTFTTVGTATQSDGLHGDQQLVTAADGSTGDHRGLQRIVLSVSEAQSISTGQMMDNEPREISVTIPSSIAGQVTGHEGTDELLQAVESHPGTTEGSHSANPPTFVAMQPGATHTGVVSSSDQQVVSVSNSDQGLAALITQADGIPGQAAGDRIVAHHGGHAQTIRMVVRQPDGTETEQTIPVSAAAADGSTLVTSDGQEIQVGDDGTLQMMANLAEQAAAGDGSNQVILNTGNSYQTVTIVPSDTNPGEVSYVLIVSQPEDAKDGVQKGMNLDMSVYDFNEGEKHGEVIAEETAPDGTKMRTIKITPKKSQTVTQAHMCNYCNYTSPKRYLLSRHMKSHSEERPHKCSVCERGFKTLASLQNHVNTHTGTRPHQCKECDAAFTTSGELVRHVRYKHTHEKPHRCTECDYASVELSKLKRHMRCHTGERPYQCPHCTYASPDTYKLKRHLRIHTGEKPYECNVCHARFTQSNSLKAHKLIHSGNKPIFQCELCPTTCGRKTDLRIHVQKLHTSDKPLKCKRCGKSFPDRYTYKVHVKTHEGEKCFKCDLCPYASISQRHLESHMLIHTDQKPFHCDECDQSFRQKQLLKRHKNLYHNPNYVPPVPKEKTHECPECQKAFRHKGNLIRHLAVHDPEASAAEKAEAMRIGQPKGPGERLDGEEDDYEEEDEELEGLSMDPASMDTADHNGQQVVVFEVIQLPAGDGSSDVQAAHVAQSAAMAMAAATGETPQGVTIIQQVANSLADEVAAAVAQVQGSENVITEVITPNRTTGDDGGVSKTNQSGLISIEPPTIQRRRGRPRKFIPLPVELTEAIGAGAGKDVEGEAIEDPIVPEPRFVRRRKADGEVEDEAAKKARMVRAFRGKIIKEEVIDPSECDSATFQPDMVAVAADPAELERREADLIRRRQEQKKKDMAECFGFNDDEDDDTILAMPAAPGVHPVSVNGDELNVKVTRDDSGDAETALHLLNSMHQNGAESVHMDTT